jgi:hypothetical protein
MRLRLRLTAFCLVFRCVSSVALSASAAPPFVIEVVDQQTGRGVPMVQLRTTAGATYYTDSQGLLAFDEPGWMDRRVFFHVRSDGYQFPADGFGFRGKALLTRPGDLARLTIERTMIAERMYRVTGSGIYRDSVRADRQAPIHEPLLNAGVVGSDSVINAVFRQRVYWFWGDTNRVGYPLGNFHVPGATSRLPGDGGLPPERGINFDYFREEDQEFAKATCRMPGDGPTWINGLMVVAGPSGQEQLFAGYIKIEPPLTVYRRGLCRWNEGQQAFEPLAEFPLSAAAYPAGHPLRHREREIDYLYFAQPFPLVRVPASAEALSDVDSYESFTCLSPGTILQDKQNVGEAVLDRDADGKLIYAWKKNTSPLWQPQLNELLKAGRIQPHESLLQLRDRDTGTQVLAHSGSVYWNPYRRRWVMIAVQQSGTSFLGEVWYAEADSLTGPWVYAVKVVTHENYSFYNPKQHPMFDQDQGRRIYFEGTYSHTFSGNRQVTPWYDYNQMMYRLSLDDERLALPVAVYRRRDRRTTLRPAAGSMRCVAHCVFCLRPARCRNRAAGARRSGPSDDGQRRCGSRPPRGLLYSSRRPRRSAGRNKNALRLTNGVGPGTGPGLARAAPRAGDDPCCWKSHAIQVARYRSAASCCTTR